MSWQAAVNRILGSHLRIFGEKVTYLPVVGGQLALVGIFNEIYTEVDPQSGAMVSTQQPNLGVRLADFRIKPAPNDRVNVRGATYLVRDCQEDGEGGAKLLLTKVTP